MSDTIKLTSILLLPSRSAAYLHGADGEASGRRLAGLRISLALALFWAWPCCASGQQRLRGEFENIDLGRRLVEPDRFPTVQELREAVRRPDIGAVVMFKLHGDGNNYYLPVWSDDGQRLALQRSDLAAKSSKLYLYEALSQPAPTPIDGDSMAYDSSFRWGTPGTASFVFNRIEPSGEGSHVYYSSDGMKPEPKTSGKRRHTSPTLYERTDGIRRLVYEAEGQITHEAWNAEGPVEEPVALARGTSPRWHRDGTRLLFARERGKSGPVAEYDIVVRWLQKSQDVELFVHSSLIVRSPTWSPDGEHCAFYVRPPGEGKPWRIQVSAARDGGSGKAVGDDVVVNPNFASEGPAWEPGGRRVWFFSHAHRRQAYYPLVAADIETGKTSLVDYPSRCTGPNDLALNPACEVPEMAFVAHDGRPQDIFILLLNHY